MGMLRTLLALSVVLDHLAAAPPTGWWAGALPYSFST